MNRHNLQKCNLRRGAQARSEIGRVGWARAAAMAAAVGLLALSCQNMLTGKDIKSQVSQDVNTANAASVTVNINANPTAGGTLSMSGSQTKKIGVAFGLTATAYDANYVFGGWTATGSGSVTFSSASASTTNVTIGKSASDIVITANFIARPAVSPYYTPSLVYGQFGVGNFLNQPIIVNFTKAMDTASFRKAGYVTVTYDSINPATPNPKAIFSGTDNSYFTLTSSATQLTLTPVSPYMPPNSTITVQLSPQICDSGEVPIGGSTGPSFYFYTGASGYTDTTKPTISGVTVLNGDSTASPAVQIPATTNYGVNSLNVTFEVTASAGSGSTTVQTLDISDGTNDTKVGISSANAYTLQAGDDGIRTLTLKVINSLQTASDPVTVNLYLDRTQPTVSGLSIASGAQYTNSVSPAITYTANDSGSGVYEYQVAENSTVGSTWSTSAPTSYAFGSSTNGTKNVYIYVKDYAGNVSSYSTASIILDNTAPSIGTPTLSCPTTGTSWAKQGSTIQLVFTASDALSGLASGSPSVTVKSGGAALTGTPSLTNSGSTCTWTYTMQSGDTDGAITYEIDASDALGNGPTKVTSGTGSVTYDHTAPSIGTPTLSCPTTGTSWAKQGSTIQLVFTASDALSGLASGSPSVTVKSGGAALTGTPSMSSSSGTYTWTYVMQSGDTNGAITYEIDASDALGNGPTKVTSGTGSVTYDKTPPVIACYSVAGGASYTTTSTPSVSFEVTKSAGSTLAGYYVEAVTHGSTPTAPTSTQWVTSGISGSTDYTSSGVTATISSFTVGTKYDIYLYVEDAAGNVAESSAAQITGDAVPVIKSYSVAGGASYTTTSTPSVSFEVTKSAGSTLAGYYVEAVTHGSTPTAPTSTQWVTSGISGSTDYTSSGVTATLSSFAAGNAYDVYLYVEDAAGNVTPSSAKQITGDAAPVIKTLSVPSYMISGTTAMSFEVTKSAGSTLAGYYLEAVTHGGTPTAPTSTQWVTTGISGQTDYTNNSVTISGLTAGSAYDVYLYVEDAAGNVTESSAAQITGDAVPAIASYSVTNVNTTSGVVTVSFEATKLAGSTLAGYYLEAVTHGTTPTAPGSSDWVTTGISGQTDYSPSSNPTITISSYSATTTYDVYLYVGDTAGNVTKSTAVQITGSTISGSMLSSTNRRGGSYGSSLGQSSALRSISTSSSSGRPASAGLTIPGLTSLSTSSVDGTASAGSAAGDQAQSPAQLAAQEAFARTNAATGRPNLNAVLAGLSVFTQAPAITSHPASTAAGAPASARNPGRGATADSATNDRAADPVAGGSQVAAMSGGGDFPALTASLESSPKRAASDGAGSPASPSKEKAPNSRNSSAPWMDILYPQTERPGREGGNEDDPKV